MPSYYSLYFIRVSVSIFDKSLSAGADCWRRDEVLIVLASIVGNRVFLFDRCEIKGFLSWFERI